MSRCIPTIRNTTAALVCLVASSVAWSQLSPSSLHAKLGLQQDPMTVLKDATTSGAVTMLPGETYFGPGPMTVGYLGAKKQIVLPNGAWVLLAVADRMSGHPTQPVPLVSMVFGQFKDGQWTSLMSYLFNGRTVNGSKSWGDAEACQAGNQVPRTATRITNVDQGAPGCAWTHRAASIPNVDDPAWKRAFEVAELLGAKSPAPPVHFTRGWVVDKTGQNYLAVRRADFDGSRSSTVTDARVEWMRAYVPLMIDGFDRRIGAAELEINQPKLPAVRVSLPD